MEPKEIERVKRKLEFLRHEARQFLLRLEQETNALNADTSQDSGDLCVLSMSKESLFERSSQQRTSLRLIDAALKRISTGSFGICVGCGDDIQSRRLEAIPWTQFCLRCQGEVEKEVGSNLAVRAWPVESRTWRRAG